MADLKTEHVKDVQGGLLLNFMQIAAQKCLTSFENKQSDMLGLNLLMATVLSNVTKSHQKLQRVAVAEEDEESMTSGESISTNTILEEIKTLVAMLETPFSQVHKMPFGKYSPPRLWTSNVLLSFLYYLQEDTEQQARSLENLLEVFIIKRVAFDGKLDFSLNCVVFWTLVSADRVFGRYVQADPDNLKKLV